MLKNVADGVRSKKLKKKLAKGLRGLLKRLGIAGDEAASPAITFRNSKTAA